MIAPTFIADAVGLASCALGLFACHGWWKTDARARLNWDACAKARRERDEYRGKWLRVRTDLRDLQTIEAARKSAQSQRMRTIGILGNKSDKRKKGG